jgi:hypothetical protein
VVAATNSAGNGTTASRPTNNRLEAVISRQPLTQGAKHIAAGRYAVELKRAAKERQGARTDLTSGSIEPAVEFGRSREKASERFGVSSASVRRAMVIVEKGTQEEVESVEVGQAPVSTVSARVAARVRAAAPPEASCIASAVRTAGEG